MRDFVCRELVLNSCNLILEPESSTSLMPKSADRYYPTPVTSTPHPLPLFHLDIYYTPIYLSRFFQAAGYEDVLPPKGRTGM